MRASGLCSTDLHLLSGRQPLGELPRIIGHELAGDVAELGDGVTQWRVGDRVTAAIDVTCGRCRHCLTGRDAALQSDAANRLRTGRRSCRVRGSCRRRTWFALPDSLDYEAAAILPDAVACMYHSLIHQGQVGIGQRVLVLGVGGLGIHGVQIARSAGADVLATSRRPERLRARDAVRSDRDQYRRAVAGGRRRRLHRRRGRRSRRRQHRHARQRPPGTVRAAAGRQVPGRGLPRRDASRFPRMRLFKHRAGDHRLPRQHQAGPDRRRPLGRNGTADPDYRRALSARATSGRPRRASNRGELMGRIVLTRP